MLGLPLIVVPLSFCRKGQGRLGPQQTSMMWASERPGRTVTDGDEEDNERHLLAELGWALRRPPSRLPRQPWALQPARPAQRPRPLPVPCSPGCLSQHGLPLDHDDPSSLSRPKWAGREAWQSRPLMGHFPNAGPAGGDSGTTPRPPSLRACDMPVLLGVNSKRTDTHETTAIFGSLCNFQI